MPYFNPLDRSSVVDEPDSAERMTIKLSYILTNAALANNSKQLETIEEYFTLSFAISLHIYTEEVRGGYS